ncbi:MAG: hypothetical protein JWP29_3630 [Rhodoferax sp.]|nr:hypothetical protein [Rhodoferax sp.]
MFSNFSFFYLYFAEFEKRTSECHEHVAAKVP